MGLDIGKTVDGYEIVEILGSSKTDVAYKVRNIFAQRFEILKVLPRSVQDDEEQKARFLREIKVHAQLLHPNIVMFYNARQLEGQLVMTTEFVPGVTLAQHIETGPIAWRDACNYSGQILSALAYAHAHGIVHRGLSSSNLILTPEGTVRLTGFGLAKAMADPELTASGSVIGALKYMAPEQVKGEAVDARSDLYSLGIVLYEMLTGKLPFAAKGQFEIMLAHVNTAPKHASDVNPDVPRELGDAVAKALAKSPDERFQNTEEFRGAIEHIGLKSESTPEVPAPLVEPLPVPAAVPEAAFNETPTPVSISEPWDAWSFDPPAEPKPAPEPQPAPPMFEAPETVDPVVNAVAVPVPPPAPANVLWDAHAIEAALLSAQSKSTESVPEVSEPAETPTSPSPYWESWSYNPKSNLAETPSLVQSAISTETALTSTSFLWDGWAANTPPPVESAPAPTVEAISSAETLPQVSSEPETVTDPLALSKILREPASIAESHSVAPPVETVAPIETAVPVASSTYSDPWTLDLPAAISQPAHVEEELAPVVESHSMEPQVETVAPIETSAPASSSTYSDPWAFDSQSAILQPPHVEEEHVAIVESHSLEPIAPVVHTDSLPPVPPAPLWDAWAVESALTSAELEPASSESEIVTPAQVLPATNQDPWTVEAEISPVESSPTQGELATLPLFNAWASEPSSAQPETQPEPSESKLFSAPAEPQRPQAEPPAADWYTKVPDMWFHQPENSPAEPVHESAEPALLSAEPLPHVPSTPEAPAPFAMSPPAPEPVPAAAAVPAPSAPAPVVKAVPPPNQDLLTALFGDTLLSRLSLALVVCAITFFLGTVTLFAVLSVTKP